MNLKSNRVYTIGDIIQRIENSNFKTEFLRYYADLLDKERYEQEERRGGGALPVYELRKIRDFIKLRLIPLVLTESPQELHSLFTTYVSEKVSSETLGLPLSFAGYRALRVYLEPTLEKEMITS